MDLNTVYENILSLGTLKMIKNSKWYELSMFIVLHGILLFNFPFSIYKIQDAVDKVLTC